MNHAPYYDEDISSELRGAYERHRAGEATEADLLAMATSETRRAMRSLPPHCLPEKGGLPHNEDHANACAHRCWWFLLELETMGRIECAPLRTEGRNHAYPVDTP